MTIFERVKKEADKQGLSLQDVASKAGFGINSIYGWKKKDPSISRVIKVAEVLGVSVDYLLNGLGMTGMMDIHTGQTRRLTKDEVDKLHQENTNQKDGLSVDEAVDNLRSYQGKLVSDDKKDVLKDLIKGYLDRKSK